MLSGDVRYRLGPFLLASEIHLPELEPPGEVVREEAACTEVSIRIGDVPESIANVVANESRWWASRQEYLLRVPGVANFLVRHGREVLVQPAAVARPADIRAYLLSPIFSTLCHQAGMYSLHASAVRIGAGVVAFLGNSGAGKSTIAAGLAQRGYTIVADDICLLDTRSNAGTTGHSLVLVIPVAPALKLWRSALDHLGTSPEALPRVFSRDDKYRINVPQANELPLRLPLREVIFLEWANEGSADQESSAENSAHQPGEPTSLTPVQGVQAVARLMEFTHCDYLMKPTGRQTGNFLLCGQILSQVRSFSLHRPRSFAHFDSTLDALEDHLAVIKEYKINGQVE